MTQPKYALHPGYVTSISDGDEHYVGVSQLAQLYGLRQQEYIVWNHELLGVSQEYYEKFEHLGTQMRKEDYDRIKKRIEEARGA